MNLNFEQSKLLSPPRLWDGRSYTLPAAPHAAAVLTTLSSSRPPPHGHGFVLVEPHLVEQRGHASTWAARRAGAPRRDQCAVARRTTRRIRTTLAAARMEAAATTVPTKPQLTDGFNLDWRPLGHVPWHSAGLPCACTWNR